MANNQYVVSVSTSEDLGTVTDVTSSGRPFTNLTKLSNWLAGFAGGNTSGTVSVDASTSTTPHSSSATVTLTSVSAGAVLGINGVHFTAVTGTPVVANNEFKRGVSDTADAASLVTAIAGSSLSTVLTATSALGVVTITSNGVGADQNAIHLQSLGVVASGTLTPVSTAATDTFLINGVTFTAEKEMARGTAQATAVVAGDVLTVNNVAFTCVASGATGNQFNYSASMTTLSTNLAAAINASTAAEISGKITAKSATDTVSLRAVASGTAANSYGLTQSGSTWTLSAATLSGGLATSNNKFDYGDTDAQTVAEIVRVIGASTSTIVTNSVRTTSTATAVTLYARKPGLEGNTITTSATGGHITASGARLTGGTIAQWEGAQATGTATTASGSGTQTIVINGVTAASVVWATSDTASAAALAAAVNASTNALVQGLVYATSSAGVVTITAIRGGTAGNNITLAVTGTGMTASGARLTTGAVATQFAFGGSAGTIYSFPGARFGGGVGLSAGGGAGANSITF